jgi:hypothetical protein
VAEPTAGPNAIGLTAALDSSIVRDGKLQSIQCELYLRRPC